MVEVDEDSSDNSGECTPRTMQRWRRSSSSAAVATAHDEAMKLGCQAANREKDDRGGDQCAQRSALPGSCCQAFAVERLVQEGDAGLEDLVRRDGVVRVPGM